MMVVDLCKYNFVPGYGVWSSHGENATQAIEEEEHDYNVTGVDRMDEMHEDIQTEILKDPPTVEAEAFFKLLKASKEPLHEQIEVTLLSFITRLMTIKCKYFLANNFYNNHVKLIRDILSKHHKELKGMY
jgi:hypothetical protein